MCWCWLAHHCETLTDSPNFWTTVSMTHVSFGLFHFPKGPSIYQLSKGLNWRLKQRVLFAHTEVPFLKPRGVAPCWMSEGLHRGVGRFHRDCKNFLLFPKTRSTVFLLADVGAALFHTLPKTTQSLWFSSTLPKITQSLWFSSLFLYHAA